MGVVLSKYKPEVESEISTGETLEVARSNLPKGCTLRDDFIEVWANLSEDIMWDVTFCSKGVLNLAIGVSNHPKHGKSLIEVEINGLTLEWLIDSKDYYEECTSVSIGSMLITKTGFTSIRMRGKADRKLDIGRLQYLQLSGAATKNLVVHSNGSGGKCAKNVYLKWSKKCRGVDMIYNEIQVTGENTDALFVVIAFYRGYLAILNGKIHFTVNNPGLNSKLAECRLPDHYKVTAVKQNDSSFVTYNEKHMRGHCIYEYDWKVGEIYRFIVTAKISRNENKSYYSAFFYLNDTKIWILLATFKGKQMPRNFSDYQSAIEDCKSFHGHYNYKAVFGPSLQHIEGKGWLHAKQIEVLHSTDSSQPNDASVYITTNNKFAVTTGESTIPPTKNGEILCCPKLDKLPEYIATFDQDAFDIT